MDADQAVNLVRRIALMLAFAEVTATAHGELPSEPGDAAALGCPDERVEDRQAALGARVSEARGPLSCLAWQLLPPTSGGCPASAEIGGANGIVVHAMLEEQRESGDEPPMRDPSTNSQSSHSLSSASS